MRDFTLGSVLGIPVRVNLSLLVFLPVLVWLIATGGQIEIYAGLITAITGRPLDVAALEAGSTAWLVGAAGAVGLFASVLLHELGHSVVARRYGVSIVSITLWIFGGMARMQELPERWNEEFWIAIAGPATSVLLGAGLLGAFLLVPASAPVAAFVVGFLGVLNVVLAVFNLLPAFPMDGGRVLRALLARTQSYARATQTAATVGKGMAVLLALVGLLGNPLLILIALFVYMAATQESRATVLRELLRGITVGDLMSEATRTVAAEDRVADLIERITLDGHTGYPVLDADGRLVGAVSLEAVRGVPETGRMTTTVRDVMTDEPVVVSPTDDAFRALQRFGEATGPLLVTAEDRLVGLLTREDLVRALEIIQGLRPVEHPEEVVPDGYA